MTDLFLIIIVKKLKAKLQWQHEGSMKVKGGLCKGMLKLIFAYSE
jgi:hypothetical protein